MRKNVTEKNMRKNSLKWFRNRTLSLALCLGLSISMAPANVFAAAPGGAPGGGSSSSSISWTGATTITSATTTSGETYSSTTASENAVLINTSSAVTLTNPTVTKSGGTSAGDDESFYGINSAVMCKGGGTTTITGADITTSAGGANGVFSYGGNASTNATSGDGTTVNISDSTITTTGNGSGGIMTTGQGITYAEDLTITTSGGSSAAIRSDRGGGTVNVDGGTYKTSGTGSPAIYATATISVEDATLTSTASQGVVNEGGNIVILEDCTVNAGNKTLGSQDKFRNGIFLYQSMSGDASDGASVFKMTDGTLNNTYGHVFHVTNTNAAITLNGVDINNSDSEGVLLSVCDDAWSGLSNEATVNATDQTLEGKILVGSDSSCDIKLSGTSKWTGSTSGAITDHRNSSTISSSVGEVNVTLGANATWTLDADCSISSLSGSGKVNTNGHTLKVNGETYTSDSSSSSDSTESSSSTDSTESSSSTDSTESSSSTDGSSSTDSTSTDNTSGTDTDGSTESSDTSVVVGQTYTVAGQTYKVSKLATSASAGTVIFQKAKNANKVTVPTTVKLADGNTYKVATVAAKAFQSKKIRTVVLSSNIEKLTAKAFYGSKAIKILVKTKQLTKSGVKGSLKGSKVKTVQVKVGTSKVNKSYVKKYKKIFTKSIAGKKVTVR